MNKAILTCILFFYTIICLFAQTTTFQQNGLEGLKRNGKVVVNARYRSVIPTGDLFLVETLEKERKVIDVNENDIIGASQTRLSRFRKTPLLLLISLRSLDIVFNH